jgi:trehalose/maltose hydrolase-like predicted phosphorylase
LMLFFLFSAEELTEIFNNLNYKFKSSGIAETVSYYRDRTSDGSTLSRIVRSWVEARSDREASWKIFRDALRSDFEDIQGGTTPEGIHLGSMAGTVDIIQRCYTGIAFRDDILWLNPELPEVLKILNFRISYRGYWLNINISREKCKVTLEDGTSETLKIGFRDKVYELTEGKEKIFDLKHTV